MNQFDSREAFRYIWLNWTIFGLSPLPNLSRVYKAYSILVNLSLPLIPAIQQIIQIFLGESIDAITINLYVSLEWVCGDVRHFVIILCFRKLHSSHQFLARLDARVRRSPDELAIMQGIVTLCGRVYFAYNVVFGINVLFGVSSLIYSRLMYEAYFPWNWQSSYSLYLLASAYEIVTGAAHSMLVLTIDCCAISYVFMMVGHVKTLGMRISRIGYDGSLAKEDNYKELIECVHDYDNVLQFFDHFRPIVGWTLFVQFFVTAFSLCLSIFYYFNFNNSYGFLFLTGAFLALLFAQIMPCCYLVNDLIVVSDNLTTNLYSCNWMDQGVKFRKALIIFMQRSQKTNTILAANLAPVTLQTCLKIIRFSFSVFTLLSQL